MYYCTNSIAKQHLRLYNILKKTRAALARRDLIPMLCDYCKQRPAVLVDRTVINNGVAEYRFCEECYKAILKSGRTAFETMQELNAGKGTSCPVCGTTARDFQKTFMFGCPDCYRNMREVAVAAAEATQTEALHVGKRPKGGRRGR